MSDATWRWFGISCLPIMYACIFGMYALVAVVTRVHNRNAAPWPQAGWYDDPNNPTLMRWWNAVEWTQYTFPRERFAPIPFAVPPA